MDRFAANVKRFAGAVADLCVNGGGLFDCDPILDSAGAEEFIFAKLKKLFSG